METERKVGQETRTFKADNDIIQGQLNKGVMKNTLKMELHIFRIAKSHAQTNHLLNYELYTLQVRKLKMVLA